MTRALLLAAGLFVTAPAMAQHAGHDLAKDQAPAKPTQPDPHAGHDMSGMAMPEQQPDPHAGHDMDAGASDIPVAPPPAEAAQGPVHAADAVFGADAMAKSRVVLTGEHGGGSAYRFLADRAEVRWGKGAEGYLLDANLWLGGDIDKLWVKSELEGTFGHSLDHGEVQALWSHAIGPFWDVQTGLRQDFGRGPDRTHAVLGLQGLAPYWFEIDAAAFLSQKGELTARIEGEYDIRITNRLILQPRAEIALSAENIPERGIGSGLSTAALGMRLRYEITPLFAPYIGLEAGRAFGRTGDYRQRDGEDRGEVVAVTGIRFGF